MKLLKRVAKFPCVPCSKHRLAFLAKSRYSAKITKIIQRINNQVAKNDTSQQRHIGVFADDER
jgi:hypothetical protein